MIPTIRTHANVQTVDVLRKEPLLWRLAVVDTVIEVVRCRSEIPDVGRVFRPACIT